MPVIDLGGWPHVHVNVPANRIRAVMTYPTDAARRAELHHTLAVEFFLSVKDRPSAWTQSPAPTQVEALLGVRHREASEDEVFQASCAASRRGSVAVEALIIIASLAQHHGGGSVNKACHILATGGRAGKATSGLVPIPYTNAKALRADAWVPYRGVAHLWAAHNLMTSFGLQQGSGDEHSRGSWWTQRGDFEKFLSLAETFRVWGESYIPHGRQKEGPVLPPHETWCLPAGIPLPELYNATPMNISVTQCIPIRCARASRMASLRLIVYIV